MSTQNSTETEVKIPLIKERPDAVAQRLQGLGFAVSVARDFEANTLYDTPGNDLRGRQMLLRLRQIGGRNVITWKGPPVAGPHKSRPEIETTFGEFEALDQILRQLGYIPIFRYEKYRTEFHDGAQAMGTVTLDETPIGNFLELEGPGDWIDATAARIGFSQQDYVLDSYVKLYLEYCAHNGIEPSGMVFASYTK